MWLAMERSLKGFRGVVDWHCLSVLVGLVGGLRLGLRRGLTLVRNRNLNPRNRGKVLGTLYLPVLQQQRKTTKRQILTEVSTHARSQRVALTRMEELRIRVVIGLLWAVPPPLRLIELITTNLSPTPAAPSPNTPNPDQGQTHPRSRPHSLRLRPSSPAFSDTHGQAQIVSPITVEQGQGFFDLENDLPVREEGRFPGRIGSGAFPAGRIGAPGGGFPITGFAGKGNGGGGGGKRCKDFGAFLARRGDEEEERRVGDVDGV